MVVRESRRVESELSFMVITMSLHILTGIYIYIYIYNFFQTCIWLLQDGYLDHPYNFYIIYYVRDLYMVSR